MPDPCIYREKERSAPADFMKMVMAKGNAFLNREKNSRASAANRKKTHAVLARMAIMVMLDVFGILALRSLNADISLELSFYQHWLTPLTVVFGVLTAAAVVYQVIAIVKKIDTSAHVVTPAMLIAIAAFCLVACLLYTRLIPMTLMIASGVGTALFIVYCLYMHVFYR